MRMVGCGVGEPLYIQIVRSAPQIRTRTKTDADISICAAGSNLTGRGSEPHSGCVVDNQL